MGWSINRSTGLTYHRSGLSTKGYTLLTPHGGQASYLIDMDGRVVQRWTFDHIRPGYGRLLNNGNLLMTGSDVNLPAPPKDEPTKAPLPFEQHVTRLGGYHTTLVEVDKDGKEVRRIHTWKLLGPIKDPIYPTTRRWEWTHLNSFDINSKGDIVFSARNVHRVAIIDAGSGKIRWKFDRTHGQHDTTWVNDKNIQVFDNGQATSRVIEIDPDTDEIIWTYHGIPFSQFFSGHISGASRLNSGNVLVCEGTSGRLFEVNQASEVVWEWINPFVNNNQRGEATVSIYRAHRYLPDHPALVDKDLDPMRFANLNRLNGLL